MSEVKTRERKCDQCGADLTKSDAAYAWHFILHGEFTPTSSHIGYDPHPTPPADRHFCDNECLARWAGVNLDAKVDDRMWSAGGRFLFGVRDEIVGNSQGIAKKLFEKMWAARRTSIGIRERSSANSN